MHVLTNIRSYTINILSSNLTRSCLIKILDKHFNRSYMIEGHSSKIIQTRNQTHAHTHTLTRTHKYTQKLITIRLCYNFIQLGTLNVLDKIE